MKSRTKSDKRVPMGKVLYKSAKVEGGHSFKCFQLPTGFLSKMPVTKKLLQITEIRLFMQEKLLSCLLLRGAVLMLLPGVYNILTSY